MLLLFTTWSLFDCSIKTCFESTGQPSVSLWRLRDQDATKVSDSVIKIDRSVADWVNISVGWDQFPFEPNLSKKISGKIDGSISPLCPDRVPLCPAAARWSSSLGQRQHCLGSHRSESQESLLGSQAKVAILFLSQDFKWRREMEVAKKRSYNCNLYCI